ncbi:hypothetical protein Tco_1146590 [Tanacetum coccineum]
MATQPNGSQVVHEDLEQIHEDDLDEMDLKWQLALLSMKARKFYQRTGKKIIINGSDTAGYDKKKSYMADEEASTNFALMAFSDSEVNKGASENVSKEVKKTSDAPIIEDWVSDCDEDETVEFRIS